MGLLQSFRVLGRLLELFSGVDLSHVNDYAVA